MTGSLQAHDRSFHSLISSRAEVTPVATGFGFAEGPVFGRQGTMYFSDPPSGRILQYHIPPWKTGPAEGKLSVFSSGRARGLTLDHQGRLLMCDIGAGQVVRREPDGSDTVLASHFRGRRLNSPHDLVCAVDGSIYFTDNPQRGQTGRAGRTGLARIHQITRGGELRVASDACGRPAGVALGPRQLDLYVTDSMQMNIRVFGIAPDGSLVSNHVFGELKSEQPGRVAGIKTDEEGNVYTAGPGGIWVFDRNGVNLGTVVLPEQPSNLCWGRAFLGLYFTARRSVYYLPTRVPGTRTF